MSPGTASQSTVSPGTVSQNSASPGTCVTGYCVTELCHRERLTQTDYAVVRRKAVGFGSEPEIRMKEL